MRLRVDFLSRGRCPLSLYATAIVLLMLSSSGADPAVAEGIAGADSTHADGADAPGDRRWSTLPSPEVLEARGAVIGRITVLTEDVFDPEHPGERNRFYRLTNRLHRTTRPDVIRRQLLFREGDFYSLLAVEESERLLRRNEYLYDAEVRVVGYRGNRVDLEVKTRDVWTLKPGISVGRSGGVNTTDFKLQDDNLFGLGKAVSIRHTSDVDRDITMFRYEDQNVLGTRVRLKVDYGNSSDGGVRLLDVGQPFFSLSSRWAANLKVLENDRVDPLYAIGQVIDEFQHQETLMELRGGLSRGLKDGRARRWIAGLTYEDHRFAEPVLASSLPPFAPPDISPDGPKRPGPPGRRPPPPKDDELDPVQVPSFLPEDRTLAYPWIGIESVSDDFEETRSLDQMGRTEDLELGWRASARLGYASQALGSDRDTAIFDAKVSMGLRPTGRQILLMSAETSGRFGRDGTEDFHVGGELRFYWRDFGQHLFFVNIELDAVHNLDSDDQLLLGGDSGLRGYPLRYQDGERRMLISLEQRFFTHWYPFRLFYVGGAVFFDIGRTWGEGIGAQFNQGLLRNAGLGLRLSSSRSGLGSVIHLDVAFPLDGDASIERVQWLIKTKKSF